ncbi:MAG: GAF domain-containing protein [Nitrospinae bacterium]|nr:GAF domain-containing protein [Nitrospinota bacterium]
MMTERAELEIVGEVAKIANSTMDLQERLDGIVEMLGERFQADVCAIVLLDEETDDLVLQATTGLNPEAVGRVRLKQGVGITGTVVATKQPIALRDASKDPRFFYVPETGEERYKSMLCVPIIDKEKAIGCIYLQAVEERDYGPGDVEFFQTVAHQISSVIRHAQLYQQARQRLTQLTALYEVGQALSSTLDLSEVLNLIAKSSSELTKATASVLRLVDFDRNELLVNAAYGLPQPLGEIEPLKLGEGISGKVVATATPMRVDDLSHEPRYSGILGRELQTLLCVPIISKGRATGALTVFGKRDAETDRLIPFSEADKRLLSTFASHAATAIENAFIYERLERLAREKLIKIRELSILYEISNAMRTTMSLDKLLQIILSCVTLGDGFGFNRAMVLMVDEAAGALVGARGVGPDSAQEAGEIWSRLAQERRSLFEWVTAADGQLVGRESRFDRMARSLNMPLDRADEILSLTVRERRAFNITDAQADPRVDEKFLEALGADAFATVPLMATDKVTGVIVVDNLFNQRPITDEDLNFISRFANHAGLAIENLVLFQKLKELTGELGAVQSRLIESERMATLGEVTAGLAHEIRNPLATIGGFARRLHRKLEEDFPYKNYASIVIREVDRLEALLGDVLAYSKQVPPSLEPCRINALVSDMVDIYREDFQDKQIALDVNLSSTLPSIEADSQQLKQVFVNLFANAMQAMPGGGTLTVITEPWPTADGEGVAITISDTGGGVPQEVLENIFNPFFTTKREGTGLGLALSKRLIEGHGGAIEVINREGDGVTFILRLPLKGR